MFPRLKPVFVLCCGVFFVLTACGGPQKAAKTDHSAKKEAPAQKATEEVVDTKDVNKDKDTARKVTGGIVMEGVIGTSGDGEGGGMAGGGGLGSKNAAAAQSATIKVTTEEPCKVMLINHKDITDELQYGWWDVWHDRKGGDQYFDTPHTFTNVEPGKYVFIVYYPDAIPDEDSGDGVVLRDLEIEAQSEHSFDFKMTDFVSWNCLSCPWLYIFDGKQHVRAFEILKDVVGRRRKTTRTYPLPASARHDGRVTLRIQEEKDEITHLDHLEVRVGDHTLTPRTDDAAHQAKLQTIDDNVVLLKKGDVLNVTFDLPADIAPDAPISLIATGHYVPDRAMLSEAFHRLQRRP